jgi:WD40 repeat protein
VTGPRRLKSSWPHTPPDSRVAVLGGHEDEVTACRFGHTGGLLVTGDRAGRLLVRDVPSGAVRAAFTWTAHGVGRRSRGVTACATGPDHQVAAGLADGTVHVIRGPDVVRTFNPDGPPVEVTKLGFLTSGRRLLIRDRGGSRVRIHDLDRGSGACPVDVSCGEHAPGCVLERWLVMGQGADIGVWDLENPNQHAVWSGHDATVIGAQRLPGLLITTDNSGVVRTWEAVTGAPVAAFVGATGRAAVDLGTGMIVLPGRRDVRIRDPRHGDPSGEVRRYRARAALRRRAARVIDRLADVAPLLADRADQPGFVDMGTECLLGLNMIATIRADDIIDGEMIRSAHEVAFHNPRTGHEQVRVRLRGQIAGAAPVPGTDRLATVTEHGSVTIWTASGDQRLVLDAAGVGSVCAMMMHPAGTLLAVADSGGEVRLVDPRIAGAPHPADDRAVPVVACAVDPLGRWAATATPERTVVVWDLAAGMVRHVFDGHPGGSWANQFTPVRIVAPGGDWMAYADGDGLVRVRDPSTGARLAVVPGEGGELATAAHPTWFATAEQDGRVRLWHPDGSLRHVLHGHAHPVHATATTPDGTLLATACQATVRLWNTASGRPGPYLPIDPDGVGRKRRLVLGVGGRLAVAGDGPALRLYDGADGRRTRAWSGQAPITAVAADPSASILVTGHIDGAVTSWSPESGAAIELGARHNAPVTACAVDPAGELVASAGDDGDLHVCDVRTGVVVGTITLGGTVACCRWAPGHRVLAAGSAGAHLVTVDAADRPLCP